MWLTEVAIGFMSWFKRPYILQTNVCAACAAHKMHIEDLQQLLKSEREGYAILLARVLPTNQVQSSGTNSDESEMKPLRQNLSLSQKRRMAEAREKAQFPDAQKEYWTKVQEEYSKAGKLPQ